MTIEEDPALPTTTRNISALFQIQRMITKEALHAVAFDAMKHRPSEFTPRKMKHPLKKYLNLKHYCAPVIHPTTGEIITKYSELASDLETREVWKIVFGK